MVKLNSLRTCKIGDFKQFEHLELSEVVEAIQDIDALRKIRTKVRSLSTDLSVHTNWLRRMRARRSSEQLAFVLLNTIGLSKGSGRAVPTKILVKLIKDVYLVTDEDRVSCFLQPNAILWHSSGVVDVMDLVELVNQHYVLVRSGLLKMLTKQINSLNKAIKENPEKAAEYKRSKETQQTVDHVNVITELTACRDALNLIIAGIGKGTLTKNSIDVFYLNVKLLASKKGRIKKTLKGIQVS